VIQPPEPQLYLEPGPRRQLQQEQEQEQDLNPEQPPEQPPEQQPEQPEQPEPRITRYLRQVHRWFGLLLHPEEQQQQPEHRLETP
jgi:hypothetical protein